MIRFPLGFLCLLLACGILACGDDHSSATDETPLADDDDNDDNDNDNDDNNNNNNDNDTDEPIVTPPPENAPGPIWKCGLGEGEDDPALFYFGNHLVEIVFDPQTGLLRQIADLRQEPALALLATEELDAATPPFVLRRIETSNPLVITVEDLEYPAVVPEFVCQDCSLLIRWQAAVEWPTVEARWELETLLPEARTRAWASNLGDLMIYSLRYPILAGLAPLADDGENDEFLFSFEGGLLLTDPLARLAEENELALDWLAARRYPIGHEAMTQMEAYLSRGVGGLLLYAADPDFTAKIFGLVDARPPESRAEGSPLPAWQLEHLNWDVLDEDDDNLFDPGYPTVLRFLDAGEWTEAAGIYRRWSDKQVWSAAPLAEREADERAFFEQVGASIFGLSARVDQRPWIEAFHNELVEGNDDARLLYVLGWDFHPFGDPEEDAYLAFAQAGRDERFWHPFVGSTDDNLAQVRDQGDLAVPFYYDLLVGAGVPGWDGFWPETGETPYYDYLLVDVSGWPGGFVSWETINQAMIYTLDPAHPDMADFWLWRDRLLTAETDPPLDGLYFDLGFSVVVWSCYDHLADADHGHPSGAGRWMIQSVRDILNQSRGTLNPRGFRYGAENLPEPYEDLVDFWHLGAAAAGPFYDRVKNTDPAVFNGPGQWIMAGEAAYVPLMSFLHHHHGALRTGGKTPISEQMGEVFYWIAAAEYLWGGVMELIYYNTPTDWLPDMTAATACPEAAERCAFQTCWLNNPDNPDVPRYWHYDDDVSLADPEKLAFLRQAIALRTASPAAPYLTLGTMEAPPTFRPDLASVSFDYDYYFSIGGDPCNHQGIWYAPPVIIAAWRHPFENRLAVLLADTLDESLGIAVEIDPAVYGFDQVELREVDLTGNGDDQSLGTGPGPFTVPLTLKPRSFRMLELVP